MARKMFAGSSHSMGLIMGLMMGMVAACSIDTGLFTEGNGAAGGGTSTGGTGTTGGGGTSTGTSTGGTTTTTSSTGGGGQGGMETGGGGQGGQNNMCAHELCQTGSALASNCDPCVQQICTGDEFCCNNEWDEACVDAVWSVCGKDCAPNKIACNAQYQFSPGYGQVCIQGNTSCDIGANIQNTTCNQLCQSAGGECYDAHNDDGSGCGFSPQPQIGCNTAGLASAVCVCSRGCGQGPPCALNQTCDNGQCMN